MKEQQRDEAGRKVSQKRRKTRMRNRLKTRKERSAGGGGGCEIIKRERSAEGVMATKE